MRLDMRLQAGGATYGRGVDHGLLPTRWLLTA